MTAILWMLGALSSFSLMAVGARELSADLTTSQIVFFRGCVSLVLIVLLIGLKRQPSLFRTRRPGLHGFRHVVHFGGQYGWFLGLGLLPLAEVFALEFTVPLWTALIAAAFLGERLTRRRIWAVVLGLAGVLVIVQPGLAIIDPASLVVLGAAICYAIAHSSTKALSASEHPLTILYYMAAIQLPLSFALALFDWGWPAPHNLAWILVVGSTALSAHFCMTRAMQSTEVSTVVCMDLLRLPLIALVGIVLYQEQLELGLIIGGSLILLANYIGTRTPRRDSGAPSDGV